MKSTLKIASRKITGSPAVLALVGILFLMSGVALAADTDIIITEIMYNPAVLSDTEGEWFEIHNNGPDPVDLLNWTIKDDGSDSHVISVSSVVPAGGYAVLARNATAMATQGVTVLYEYTGYLANAEDEVVLLNASMVEIDRVVYTVPPWDGDGGASMMWNEATADNNIMANWFVSTIPFGDGDMGTPGAANPTLQPPAVTDVYRRPLLPEPAEPVTVHATITDGDGTLTATMLFVQINGGGFTGSSMTLDTGDVFTGTIAGGTLGDVVDYYVSATDNDGQTATNPGDAPTGFYSYTVANEVITPISSIHNDTVTYPEGTLVMVQGQVYIPGNYKADGSVSAFIQDGSGRGLNIYGTYLSDGGDLLNDTSAIVKVSGYVDYYYTTLEIVRYEVEVVSTGNPELTPSTQTTVAAAAPTNEGTYVHSTGPITAIATTGTSGYNLAYNFTVDDGSGPLVIRIDEDLVLGMDTWLLGDELEGAGAGATYGTQGQIIVGLATKVTNHGQGPDVTPPLLTSAVLTSPLLVTLIFDEALDPVTATDTANYQVYQTDSPGVTITVTGAVQPFGSVVELTLATSASGTSHTVQVDNVEDVAGNPIAAGTTMEIGGPPAIVINEVMQDPYVISDTVGEWFEVYNSGISAVDMNGWTIADLGTNTHTIDNGGPLIINPGEYKVLGINATEMALQGVTLFYEYSGIALGNSDDELILTDTLDQVMASIAWDGGPVWPDPTGHSMQWTGSGDNNDGTTWVGAYVAPVFGTGDRGTPGTANDFVTDVPAAGYKTALDPNYPNPFNPRTSFSFSLDKSERVTLVVYDVSGRKVSTILDSVLPAGRYDKQFSWDGMNDRGAPANSGTYFYRLTTGSGFSESGKMMLLK